MNTPKRIPFRNDAKDGRNKRGITFLSPYLDMENMRMKFMILPINNCGCLNMNGTVKANTYTTASWSFSFSNILLRFCF